MQHKRSKCHPNWSEWKLRKCEYHAEIRHFCWPGSSLRCEILPIHIPLPNSLHTLDGLVPSCTVYHSLILRTSSSPPKNITFKLTRIAAFVWWLSFKALLSNLKPIFNYFRKAWINHCQLFQCAMIIYLNLSASIIMASSSTIGQYTNFGSWNTIVSLF